MNKKRSSVFVIGLLSLLFFIHYNSSSEIYPGLSYPTAQGKGDSNEAGGECSIGDERLSRMEVMDVLTSIAVPFVRNSGQFEDKVIYEANLFSGRFFLTQKDLVYSFIDWPEENHISQDKFRKNTDLKNCRNSFKGLALREFFIDEKGTKIDFTPAGEQKTETVISYFKGKDAKKWRSGLAAFQSISLGQLYPGIEVKLKAHGLNVEKVFCVSPESRAEVIKIGFEGIEDLKVADDGRLILLSALGELSMRAPFAWQEIESECQAVKVSYRILDDYIYGFEILGKYDKDYPIFIDPEFDTLLGSSFLGGRSRDRGYSIALDESGNVYLTGYTESPNFPKTSGVYDKKKTGWIDVFISKLDGNLTKLLASTFLGGKSEDYGYSLALDSSGNIYLTGYTNSEDFPITAGAYDPTYNVPWITGNGDVFISQLNSSLTELLSSTFLGGDRIDKGYNLALDSSGNVYLTGYTSSFDFPTTAGAYDRDKSYDDVFISKLNGSLTELLASTFLGGKDDDYGYSLALDKKGRVYLTGMTWSSDFPTTARAYDSSYNDFEDVFVSKLDKDLTKLLASTFLGGTDYESGYSLALDSNGNVYVTGETGSNDYPTTRRAYSRSFNGGDNDVFISRLNKKLTRLVYSTYVGGSSYGYEMGNFIVLDTSSNVYLVGRTESDDFPITSGAFDPSYNGGNGGDVFISKFNKKLNKLLGSTFLGGTNYDNGLAMALDSSGNVYLTGYTASSNFPTTNKAYDQKYNKWEDVFISKLNNSLDSMKR